MIPFIEIETVATKLGVSRETIEKDYCLTWFLFGLAESPLWRDIIFYGGTALKKIYFSDYRFSEDLDLASEKYLKEEEILHSLERIYAYINEKANIDFETAQESLVSQGERLQFFVRYEGFPRLLGAKQFKVDLLRKIEDKRLAICRKILSNYSDMKGFKKELQVYTLETMFVDKLGMVLDPSRSEPRDLYDLWYLLRSKGLNLLRVKVLFKKRYGFPLPLEAVESGIRGDLYRTRWRERLANQMHKLPDIDIVLKETISILRKGL